MRLVILLCAFSIACQLCTAQEKAPAKPESKSGPKVVTVPATIDHNRVIVDADIPLPDGSSERVHAWVDTGNPDFYLSRRLATALGLKVSCDDRECSAPTPQALVLGGMTISLTDITQARIPLRPVNAASVLARGMSAEITIPSIVLRHYDVLIDFAEHKLTIGAPGSIHFLGSSGKVQIDANGLIEIPAQIEKKKFSLALDLGSSMSFLSVDTFEKLTTAHVDWPHMTGAVGPANVWGSDDEAKWKVMRVDRLQAGPLFLTDAAMASLPNEAAFIEKPSAASNAGILGANLLQNYRVGLDYARSTVYFDIGRMFNFPDFDVVGITLRPEDDGRFTIIGVVDFEGKPAVDALQAGDQLVAINDIAVRGASMGQLWAMLGGNPGQERRLTVDRGGKEFTVVAQVRHFLGAEESDPK